MEKGGWGLRNDVYGSRGCELQKGVVFVHGKYMDDKFWWVFNANSSLGMWKQMKSWKKQNAESGTVYINFQKKKQKRGLKVERGTKKNCSIEHKRNAKKTLVFTKSSMVNCVFQSSLQTTEVDTVFSLKKMGYLAVGVAIHLNKKMRLSRESLPVVGVELRYRKLCWKPLNTPRYICILSNGFKFHHRTYVFPQKKRPFPNLKKLLAHSLRIIVVSHLFCGGRIF